MYNSELSVIAKVNVPVSTNLDVTRDDYIGFLVFPQNKCGDEFLLELSAADYNGTVYSEIFDYESQYTMQYVNWKYIEREDKPDRLQAAVLQFHRAASRLGGRDMGSKKRDSFFLHLFGAKFINFKSNLESCIQEMYVGSMPVNRRIDGKEDANWSECALEEKDFRKK